MEDEEQGVSSYWMSLGKIVVTVNWKRKHYLSLCGELASEEATELTLRTTQNEHVNMLISIF